MLVEAEIETIPETKFETEWCSDEQFGKFFVFPVGLPNRELFYIKVDWAKAQTTEILATYAFDRLPLGEQIEVYNLILAEAKENNFEVVWEQLEVWLAEFLQAKVTYNQAEIDWLLMQRNVKFPLFVKNGKSVAKILSPFKELRYTKTATEIQAVKTNLEPHPLQEYAPILESLKEYLLSHSIMISESDFREYEQMFQNY